MTQVDSLNYPVVGIYFVGLVVLMAATILSGGPAADVRLRKWRQVFPFVWLCSYAVLSVWAITRWSLSSGGSSADLSPLDYFNSLPTYAD